MQTDPSVSSFPHPIVGALKATGTDAADQDQPTDRATAHPASWPIRLLLRSATATVSQGTGCLQPDSDYLASVGETRLVYTSQLFPDRARPASTADLDPTTATHPLTTWAAERRLRTSWPSITSQPASGSHTGPSGSYSCKTIRWTCANKKQLGLYRLYSFTYKSKTKMWYQNA